MPVTEKKAVALIVEDDEVAAMQLKRILGSRFSMDVVLARDYPQARLRLEAGDFDIVTVDYTLPGGAGVRLLEEITSAEDHPPVILVGGRGDENAARALRPSVSGYVVKDSGMEAEFASAVEKGLAEVSLKRAERALKDEQSFIEAALNALPDTFFVLKLDGTGIRWNRRLGEVTGYTEEEIASMTPADFFRGEDLERVAGLLSRASAGELENASVEVTLYTKDGRGIPYEYFASLLKDAGGTPLSICGVGRDISARKRAEAETASHRDSLEALVGERTELLWEANQKLAREVDERQRAQDELRRRESYFRSIVQYSTDIIGVFDSLGTILYISPSVTGILGHRVESITGRNAFDYIHPEDLAAVIPNHEFVTARSEVERSAECRFLDSEGSWRILETVGRSYTDESGEARIVVNARDVTERKKVEEELRESRNNLSAFFNASRESAILIEPDGVVIAINEMGAKRLGKSGVEAMTGTDIFEHMPARIAASRRERLAEVLQKREPVVFEDERDGILQESSLYPILDNSGEVTSVAITTRDITERNRAEEELRESRDNMLAFLDATTDYAMLLRPDGMIAAVNRAMAERFGVSAEELVGTSMYDRASVSEEVQRRRVRWIEEVLRTGKPGRFEDEREGMFFEHRVYPVFDGSGSVDRIAFFTRDITERKQAEGRIRQEHENLAAFMNSTTDYTMLIDAGGRILAVNRALAGRLGMEVEEIIGLSVDYRTVLPPEIRSERVAGVREVIEKGKPVRFEDYRDGMHFEHNLYPVFNAAGDVDRVAFTSRDITERKRAEAALKRSESQFRTLVEQLPVVTYTAALGEPSTTTYISPQVERLLGIPSESWTSRPDLRMERIHPDDREQVLRELASSHESGEPFVSEYRMMAADGHIVFVRDEAMVIRDDAGNPLFMQGIMSDITARRFAEQALRESEEKYRLHFDNSYDVIYALDSESRITTMSPSIERVLGYKPEELIGRNFTDLNLLSPESLELAVSNALRIFRGERVISQYAFIAKDGTTRYGEVTGAPLRKNGDTVGSISVARDITERRLAEEALKQSEERYRSIYTVTPDIVYLMDSDGIMLDANPVILERLGMSLDEFKDTHFMDYFAGDDTAELNAAMERLRNGEEVRGLELKAGIEPDIFVYEINARPLFENGRVIKILSLARDITERKRNEEELKRLNRELDGYALTVSHDLRTPLSAIKLANETLQKVWARRDELDLDLDKEIRRFGEIIELGTVKTEARIEDILRLARAGKEPLEVSLVNVYDTVEMVLAERGPLIRDRGVWVEVDKDLGGVWANPTHIYQLFGNIIDNAIKHNDGPSPAVEVRYLGKSAGDIHHYKIKDNGPGIPPADLEDIFLPFVKGESGETGIGLAIVDKIVKLHGGTIRAYNNGGATFEFFIRDMPMPAQPEAGS